MLPEKAKVKIFFGFLLQAGPLDAHGVVTGARDFTILLIWVLTLERRAPYHLEP